MADLLQRSSQISVPVTVLGELDAAFRQGGRRRENEQRLREFLEAPFVSVLEVTADVARRYGQIVTELRSAGTPIATNDIWIAATAMSSGAHLVTFDADFERVAGLDATVLRPS